MYNNMLEELRSKEREAHLQEKKDLVVEYKIYIKNPVQIYKKRS